MGSKFRVKNSLLSVILAAPNNNAMQMCIILCMHADYLMVYVPQVLIKTKGGGFNPPLPTPMSGEHF